MREVLRAVRVTEVKGEREIKLKSGDAKTVFKFKAFTLDKGSALDCTIWRNSAKGINNEVFDVAMSLIRNEGRYLLSGRVTKEGSYTNSKGEQVATQDFDVTGIIPFATLADVKKPNSYAKNEHKYNDDVPAPDNDDDMPFQKGSEK